MNLCDINDIKYLLSKNGFRFSKSMGQNFLIESWVPERFVAEAGIGKQHGVLEIGPGIGCLTQILSRTASKVVSVELDSKLMPVLEETLAECDNTEVINADILKTDFKKVIKEQFSELTPVVCANLPYNITSPVLTMLVEGGEFDNITVMIQKEVAMRICAKPKTSDYGAFTLFMNYYVEPRILFDVPPSCFIPQPKVNSSVITLKRLSSSPVNCTDKKYLFSVIKASFAQRRKILLNGLNAVFGNKLGKETIAEIILKCGFSENVRGEELSLSDFARLADELQRNMSCRQ